MAPVWRRGRIAPPWPWESWEATKGKSQIWGSKKWSRFLRDSDPRKTALTRTSSIYKRQTRTLVRKGAPQKQGCNCQRVINICSWAPDVARHPDLLIDRQSQCDFDLCSVKIPCEGWVECLHRSPARRRRRQKGSLESETAKYGREFHGTRTLEWLIWREQQQL
jgi:hypothetical protein